MIASVGPGGMHVGGVTGPANKGNWEPRTLPVPIFTSHTMRHHYRTLWRVLGRSPPCTIRRRTYRGLAGYTRENNVLACSHASINPRSTSSSTNIYAVSQEAGLVYIACIAHARVMGGRIARNIRACAIDVDGTLMNSAGVITPATIAVLQRARAQVLRRGPWASWAVDVKPWY